MINELTHKNVLAIVPKAVAINTALTALEIDTVPGDTGAAEYVTILLQIGATDCGFSSLKLQGTETSGAGYADIVGADFSVAGLLPGAGDGGKIWAWHLSTRKLPRFLKIVGATANIGATGAAVAAVAIFSRLEQLAQSASKRGVAQELFV